MSTLLAALEPLRLALPWLVTYLLHSTVGALLALLLVPRLRRAATRDGLWKLALAAPLVSASVAQLVPGGGAWLSIEVSGTAHDAGPVALDARGPGARLHLPAGVVPPAELGDEDGSSRPATGASRPTPASPMLRWGGVVGLALAASLLALGRLARSRRRLARSLAERRTLDDPRLLRALPDAADLCWSEHPDLPGPVALGHREICLPSGEWRDLDEAELRAVLGHEHAHLERRDPLLLGLVDAWVAATVWQPLNHLLRARLRCDVELACDARAARLTGDPLGLVRVLERFARRIGEPVPAMPGLATMAPGPSALVQRVEHLLAGEHGPERRRTRALAALAAGLVLGLLACQGPALDEHGPDGAVDLTDVTGEQAADHTDATVGESLELTDVTEGTVDLTDVTEAEVGPSNLPPGTVLLHLDRDGHVPSLPWVPGTSLTRYADELLALLVERLDDEDRSEARLEPIQVGGMTLRANRVVLSLDPDMPFVHALRWMERMAQPTVGLHRISLRVTGSEAEPVVVDLPTDLHDLEVPVEEPEDGSEPPVTLPVQPTIYLAFDPGHQNLEVSDPRLSAAAKDLFLRGWPDRDRIRSRFRTGEALLPAGEAPVRLPEDHRVEVSLAPDWSAEQVMPELWAFTQLLDPVRFTFVAPLPEPTPEGR